MKKEFGKILVVDDNTTNLKVVVESLQSLKKQGATILIAKSGEKALEIANRIIPNIILLDINMPGMDGFETCSHLKKNPKTADIPIIFLTAQTDIESKLKGLRIGAIDYITKPFYKEEVVTRVKSQLEIWNLKRSLKIQNDGITQSLLYAQRIQAAILPSQQHIEKYIPNSFIFYQPKDIVSGDFYWLLGRDNYTYIAAIDCTGHGIPGAFMSFVGFGVMNEIILKGKSPTPADMLAKMDVLVKRYLNQNHYDSHTQDGMDIALCRIDKKNKLIDFSGALRPLYFIQNGQFIEVKGSRMPIGGTHYTDKEFINHSFSYQKGDCIYLSSDGYADQFGGPSGKKFSLKQLKQVLIDLIGTPIDQQNKVLEKKFFDWKQDEEAVDDVLLLGVEL